MMKPQKPIESAIHYAGGVTRLASAIGITQSAISNWKARGTIPNAAYCPAIERATNGLVTRQDLRPNDWWAIWPELAVHTDKEPANSPPLPSLPAPTFSSSGRGGLSQRTALEAAA